MQCCQGGARYRRSASSHRMSDLTGDPQWRRIRLEVLDRDGWLCRINGPKCTLQATEADHIIPLEFGGARYDKANLRAACKTCNAGRRPAGSRTASELSLSREW